MKVRFWGVRGSIPVPGRTTNRYGGNTSCVEVRPDRGDPIIIDAGTGIRKLGKSLMEAGWSPTAAVTAVETGLANVCVLPIENVLEGSVTGPSTFINDGTLRRSAGTGSARFEVALRNTGLIELLTGTLMLGDFSQTSGEIRLAGAAITGSVETIM